MFLIIETIKGHVITGIIDYETYLNSYDDDDILDKISKFNTNLDNECNIKYAKRINIISDKFILNNKFVYSCTYAENPNATCIISARLFDKMVGIELNKVLKC